MQTPNWANKLAVKVCARYKRKVPRIKWYNMKRKGSSGRAYRRYISVRAGTDQMDAKHVLLHELAHWINGRIVQKGHNKKFWRLAFTLYAEEGFTKEYSLAREKWYKGKAVEVYNEIYGANEVFESDLSRYERYKLAEKQYQLTQTKQPILLTN